MANYQETVVAKGQASVTKANQQPEQRRKVPSVMELALKNQEFSIPNANELRTSILRPVEIGYFKDVAAGVATAKSHNHTGGYGDTGKVSLVYVTHVETLSLPKKIAENNFETYQRMFDNLYGMKWKNLRTRHDDSARAFLTSNRVQLSAATMNGQLASANPGTWNDSTFALEIAAANNHRFIQKAKSAMMSRKMNFGLGYDVIADLQLADEFEYAMQQGQANNANTAFQFADCSIGRTQDVIDDQYANGSMLILPGKMFAGMYWNEPLNKRGLADDKGGTVGFVGTVKDPFGSGAIADISGYTDRVDTSANIYGGNPQDFLDEYEISLTIAYALPPMSTAGDSVVMEVSRGN